MEEEALCFLALFVFCSVVSKDFFGAAVTVVAVLLRGGVKGVLCGASSFFVYALEPVFTLSKKEKHKEVPFFEESVSPS